MFTRDLLQAINDWQRGGDANQKKRRGEALKKAAKSLPLVFRQVSGTCYRQIAFDNKSVWQLGTEYQVQETLSAWSESLEAAKDFKGGVPPIGYQGIIFKIKPGTGTVILNLSVLFRDTEFNKAVEENKTNIISYDKGIGRYGASQAEVVIETEFLPLDSLHAWGGYSSSESNLAEMYFGRAASDDELDWLRSLMKQDGLSCGPRWLSTPEAVKRVSEKLKCNGKRLSKLKESQL